MNMPLPAYNKILFDLEVLRARMEIRDFFLMNLYREVYENIGQLLSLARVMLAQNGDHVGQASELVGQSIRELREMCRGFDADEDLLKEEGFGQAITKITTIIFPGSEYLVKQISMEDEHSAGLKLIVFSMLLELLRRIKAINGKPELVAVSFSQYNIDCNLHYRGDPFPLDGHMGKQFGIEPVSLQQKATLINGKLEVLQNADGITHLKLFCPTN